MNKVAVILLLFFFAYASTAEAQKVTVSDEIQIRADDHFRILGQVGDRILLLTVKNQKTEVYSYDLNLGLRNEKELDLTGRHQRIIGTLGSEDHFFVFTQLRRDSDLHIIKWKYDPRLNLTDSATVAIASQMQGYSRFLMTESEDRSKVLFFRSDNAVNLQTFCFDIHSEEVIWSKNFQIKGNLRQDFRKMLLANSGELVTVIERTERRFRRSGMHYEFYHFSGEGEISSPYILKAEDIHNYSNEFTFDNRHNQVIAAGMFYERSSSRADGHYHFRVKIGSPITHQFHHRNFSSELLAEVSAQNVSRNGISEIQTNDILLRQDGGIVVFSEIEKIFERRPLYSQRGWGRSYGRSGWVDYQLEDVLITAFHPDGRLHWHEIIYKKQYSQDDGAVYSSYSIFKSPSFLRILYNDEVSNHSTVSEFLLAAHGLSERKSVLSTAYQDLKLRFSDALQISSDTIIIPSENRSRLKLVKVVFDR